MDVAKIVRQMVRKYPNNMELGEKIRQYVNEVEEDDTTYIYESADGGDTIYRRRFGDYENREKISG